MKKLSILPFLLVVFYTGFSQNPFSRYDAYIASTFDVLHKKPFIELPLQDTSGQVFNTADLRGKTLYVDFWFTTCAPCIKEIPFAKSLHDYFATDTNIVFVNICIDNVDRKTAWKQMIKERQMPGIHLFYARNRPQKINLLKEYKITFPTYLLVNNEMEIIGYNAPRPSEKGLVHWVITKAESGWSLSKSYAYARNNLSEYRTFLSGMYLNKR